MRGNRFSVLMITTEAVPFAKTGGLADAVSSLAAVLASQGNDVRILLPRYASGTLDGAPSFRHPGTLRIPVGDGGMRAGVIETRLPGSGVPVYLLENDELYGRPGIYGDRREPDYRDNVLRFAFLSRAAFQLCRSIQWIPDVMHAHDWGAALVPVYLNRSERHGPFEETASLLSIHNLGYQGIYDARYADRTGLSPEIIGEVGLEFHDRINLLQGGILQADIIGTVSPTYANEIQTPDYGYGLDALLRRRRGDLFGVLNGIDEEVWNPENDRYLPESFSADDLSGKERLKALLQEEFGLPVQPDVPLVGMVTRLAEQKGITELCHPDKGCLDQILRKTRVQVIVLGNGELWCEQELLYLERAHANIRAKIGFDIRLSHLIEAGSDFFLMPSRYEPCGLNQMYSLRYGTLPIVRRTGGLADTVENFDQESGAGTGFMFDDLTPQSIFDTVGWALWAYRQFPDKIREMRRRGMRQDFSWNRSALRYQDLYQWALDRRSGRYPRSR